MISAGEVGEPVSAVLQSRDPGAPPFAYVQGGGGLFKDMGKMWLALALRSGFRFDVGRRRVLHPESWNQGWVWVSDTSAGLEFRFGVGGRRVLHPESYKYRIRVGYGFTDASAGLEW